MTATARRAWLTPHQTEVYHRLLAMSARRVDAIGSRSALDHLVNKGYAALRIERGPLGGEHRYYRPVTP